MPGSVPNASPTLVMPHSLCSVYTQMREFAMQHQDYADGRRERKLLVATSRKRWQIGKRMTAAQLATLRTFYETCGGPLVAFYFYDVWDVRTAVHDPTGVATLGRVTARFDSPWSQTAMRPRSHADLQLIEVN